MVKKIFLKKIIIAMLVAVSFAGTASFKKSSSVKAMNLNNSGSKTNKSLNGGGGLDNESLKLSYDKVNENDMIDFSKLVENKSVEFKNRFNNVLEISGVFEGLKKTVFSKGYVLQYIEVDGKKITENSYVMRLDANTEKSVVLGLGSVLEDSKANSHDMDTTRNNKEGGEPLINPNPVKKNSEKNRLFVSKNNESKNFNKENASSKKGIFSVKNSTSSLEPVQKDSKANLHDMNMPRNNKEGSEPSKGLFQIANSSTGKTNSEKNRLFVSKNDGSKNFNKENASSKKGIFSVKNSNTTVSSQGIYELEKKRDKDKISNNSSQIRDFMLGKKRPKSDLGEGNFEKGDNVNKVELLANSSTVKNDSEKKDFKNLTSNTDSLLNKKRYASDSKNAESEKFNNQNASSKKEATSSQSGNLPTGLETGLGEKSSNNEANSISGINLPQKDIKIDDASKKPTEIKGSNNGCLWLTFEDMPKYEAVEVKESPEGVQHLLSRTDYFKNENDVPVKIAGIFNGLKNTNFGEGLFLTKIKINEEEIKDENYVMHLEPNDTKKVKLKFIFAKKISYDQLKKANCVKLSPPDDILDDYYLYNSVIFTNNNNYPILVTDIAESLKNENFGKFVFSYIDTEKRPISDGKYDILVNPGEEKKLGICLKNKVLINDDGSNDKFIEKKTYEQLKIENAVKPDRIYMDEQNGRKSMLIYLCNNYDHSILVTNIVEVLKNTDFGNELVFDYILEDEKEVIDNDYAKKVGKNSSESICVYLKPKDSNLQEKITDSKGNNAFSGESPEKTDLIIDFEQLRKDNAVTITEPTESKKYTTQGIVALKNNYDRSIVVKNIVEGLKKADIKGGFVFDSILEGGDMITDNNYRIIVWPGRTQGIPVLLKRKKSKLEKEDGGLKKTANWFVFNNIAKSENSIAKNVKKSSKPIKYKPAFTEKTNFIKNKGNTDIIVSVLDIFNASNYDPRYVFDCAIVDGKEIRDNCTIKVEPDKEKKVVIRLKLDETNKVYANYRYRFEKHEPVDFKRLLEDNLVEFSQAYKQEDNKNVAKRYVTLKNYYNKNINVTNVYNSLQDILYKNGYNVLKMECENGSSTENITDNKFLCSLKLGDTKRIKLFFQPNRKNPFGVSPIKEKTNIDMFNSKDVISASFNDMRRARKVKFLEGNCNLDEGRSISITNDTDKPIVVSGLFDSLKGYYFGKDIEFHYLEDNLFGGNPLESGGCVVTLKPGETRELLLWFRAKEEKSSLEMSYYYIQKAGLFRKVNFNELLQKPGCVTYGTAFKTGIGDEAAFFVDFKNPYAEHIDVKDIVISLKEEPFITDFSFRKDFIDDIYVSRVEFGGEEVRNDFVLALKSKATAKKKEKTKEKTEEKAEEKAEEKTNVQARLVVYIRPDKNYKTIQQQEVSDRNSDDEEGLKKEYRPVTFKKLDDDKNIYFPLLNSESDVKNVTFSVRFKNPHNYPIKITDILDSWKAKNLSDGYIFDFLEDRVVGGKKIEDNSFTLYLEPHETKQLMAGVKKCSPITAEQLFKKSFCKIGEVVKTKEGDLGFSVSLTNIFKTPIKVTDIFKYIEQKNPLKSIASLKDILKIDCVVCDGKSYKDNNFSLGLDPNEEKDLFVWYKPFDGNKKVNETNAIGKNSDDSNDSNKDYITRSFKDMEFKTPNFLKSGKKWIGYNPKGEKITAKDLAGYVAYFKNPFSATVKINDIFDGKRVEKNNFKLPLKSNESKAFIVGLEDNEKNKEDDLKNKNLGVDANLDDISTAVNFKKMFDDGLLTYGREQSYKKGIVSNQVLLKNYYGEDIKVTDIFNGLKDYVEKDGYDLEYIRFHKKNITDNSFVMPLKAYDLGSLSFVFKAGKKDKKQDSAMEIDNGNLIVEKDNYIKVPYRKMRADKNVDFSAVHGRDKSPELGMAVSFENNYDYPIEVTNILDGLKGEYFGDYNVFSHVEDDLINGEKIKGNFTLRLKSGEKKKLMVWLKPGNWYQKNTYNDEKKGSVEIVGYKKLARGGYVEWGVPSEVKNEQAKLVVTLTNPSKKPIAIRNKDLFFALKANPILDGFRKDYVVTSIICRSNELKADENVQVIIGKRDMKLYLSLKRDKNHKRDRGVEIRNNDFDEEQGLKKRYQLMSAAKMAIGGNIKNLNRSGFKVDDKVLCDQVEFIHLDEGKEGVIVQLKNDYARPIEVSKIYSYLSVINTLSTEDGKCYVVDYIKDDIIGGNVFKDNNFKLRLDPGKKKWLLVVFKNVDVVNDLETKHTQKSLGRMVYDGNVMFTEYINIPSEKLDHQLKSSHANMALENSNNNKDLKEKESKEKLGLKQPSLKDDFSLKHIIVGDGGEVKEIKDNNSTLNLKPDEGKCLMAISKIKEKEKSKEKFDIEPERVAMNVVLKNRYKQPITVTYIYHLLKKLSLKDGFSLEHIIVEDGVEGEDVNVKEIKDNNFVLDLQPDEEKCLMVISKFKEQDKKDDVKEKKVNSGVNLKDENKSICFNKMLDEGYANGVELHNLITNEVEGKRFILENKYGMPIKVTDIFDGLKQYCSDNGFVLNYISTDEDAKDVTDNSFTLTIEPGYRRWLMVGFKASGQNKLKPKEVKNNNSHEKSHEKPHEELMEVENNNPHEELDGEFIEIECGRLRNDKGVTISDFIELEDGKAVVTVNLKNVYNGPILVKGIIEDLIDFEFENGFVFDHVSESEVEFIDNEYNILLSEGGEKSLTIYLKRKSSNLHDHKNKDDSYDGDDGFDDDLGTKSLKKEGSMLNSKRPNPDSEKKDGKINYKKLNSDKGLNNKYVEITYYELENEGEGVKFIDPIKSEKGTTSTTVTFINTYRYPILLKNIVEGLKKHKFGDGFVFDCILEDGKEIRDDSYEIRMGERIAQERTVYLKREENNEDIHNSNDNDIDFIDDSETDSPKNSGFMLQHKRLNPDSEKKNVNISYKNFNNNESLNDEFVEDVSYEELENEYDGVRFSKSISIDSEKGTIYTEVTLMNNHDNLISVRDIVQGLKKHDFGGGFVFGYILENGKIFRENNYKIEIGAKEKKKIAVYLKRENLNSKNYENKGSILGGKRGNLELEEGNISYKNLNGEKGLNNESGKKVPYEQLKNAGGVIISRPTKLKYGSGEKTTVNLKNVYSYPILLENIIDSLVKFEFGNSFELILERTPKYKGYRYDISLDAGAEKNLTVYLNYENSNGDRGLNDESGKNVLYGQLKKAGDDKMFEFKQPIPSNKGIILKNNDTDAFKIKEEDDGMQESSKIGDRSINYGGWDLISSKVRFKQLCDNNGFAFSDVIELEDGTAKTTVTFNNTYDHPILVTDVFDGLKDFKFKDGFVFDGITINNVDEFRKKGLRTIRLQKGQQKKIIVCLKRKESNLQKETSGSKENSNGDKGFK